MLFGKHFRKYYLTYGIFFVMGISILIIVNMVQLEIPQLVGKIIDELNDYLLIGDRVNVDKTLILKSIRTMAIITAIMVAGRILWRFFIFGTARRIEYQLRNKMFSHSLKLSQSFYSKEKVGGMMTYYINDLEAVRMAFGPGLLMLVDGVVLGGLALRKMFRLSVSLTFYAAIPMFLMILVMIFVSKQMQKRFKARQKAFEDLSDFTQENFSGIAVIKAFVRELKELMFFQKRSENLKDKTVAFVRFHVLVHIVIGIAINLVVLITIGYGGFIVLRNPASMSPGQLSEYLQYYFTLVWPTMAIARFISIQSQAKASASRISDFLDQEVEVKDSEDVIDINHLEGNITASNLSFKYPDGGDLVLEDISFEIKAGEMIGILGRTGSGKSSLVELLLRMYNVPEGQLFIDGHDVNKLPIRKVRDLMGYVPQDNFLFSDTIANNIGFSYEIIDEPKLIEASKYADVYGNIMGFTHQFDTMLGERGVTVSGGQKQRISIARAIAKDPQILILDDSVSAVDTQTEEAIINNMFEIRKGKTTIFIAHRISTVKRMDKIILLEKGKIIGIGSHDELLETSSVYKQMVKLQTLESMLEGGEK